VHAQLARLRGAFVATSEVSPARLGLSRQYCADWAIDARTGKLPDLIRDRFPNGFDLVAESTGFQPLIEDAMQCVKAGGFNRGGKFIFLGWYPDTISFKFHLPHSKQLQCSSRLHRRTAEPGWGSETHRIRSPQIDPLISHVVRWRDAAELYSRLFTPERDSFNGIVIDWRE